MALDRLSIDQGDHHTDTHLDTFMAGMERSRRAINLIQFISALTASVLIWTSIIPTLKILEAQADPIELRMLDVASSSHS